MSRTALTTALYLGLLPLLSASMRSQEPKKPAPGEASPPAATETSPSTQPAQESSVAARTLSHLQSSGRSFKLPDGSRVHLLPRKGRRIAHWATWVSMGEKDQPIGAQGLAEACMRASLLGTSTRGSRNWGEEKRALDLVDETGFAVANALAQGKQGEEIQTLKKAYRDARMQALRWSNPGKARRDLMSLPVRGPIIRSGADGSLLLASIPSSRILDFAAFMDERRRSAVLRGFHEQLYLVRQALARNAADPFLIEARLQAIRTHPVRGSHGLPRFITRSEALRFYQRHQRPERTVTVIVGDFDADRIAEGLRTLFTTPGDPTIRPPLFSPEAEQRGLRESSLELPGDPTIVFAWRIPPGTSRSGLELLAHLLGQGPSSLLGRRLQGETHLARQVDMFPSYPGLQGPSLFVLRIVCAEWDQALYEKLVTEGREVVQRLRDRGFDDKEFALARGSLMAKRLAIIGDESQLAARMARDLGTLGKIDLLPPDQKTCEALIDSILQRSRLTVVRTALDSFGEKEPTETEPTKKEPSNEEQTIKEEGR